MMMKKKKIHRQKWEAEYLKRAGSRSLREVHFEKNIFWIFFFKKPSEYVNVYSNN